MRAPGWVFAAIVALGVPGCGGKQEAKNESPEQVQIQTIDQRLRGAWKLTSYKPETPLEPMLQAMLNAQYGVMIVRFDGKRMTADSPGLHVDRAYKVSYAYGDAFKATVTDEAGATYDSQGRFDGDDALTIWSMTSPWRGVAQLQRIR